MEALRAELAGLRAANDRLTDAVLALAEDQRFAIRMALAPLDRTHLATLLPAALELFGDSEWTVADVYAEALRGDTAPARDLQALVDAFETPDGGLRSLGGFLERCAGRTSGGLRLVAVGKTRGAVLYLARHVSRRFKHAQPLPETDVIADHGNLITDESP
jgi:hypothetical protein